MTKFSRRGYCPPQNWAAPALAGWLFLFLIPELFSSEAESGFQWGPGFYRVIFLSWQRWVNKLSPCLTPESCWLLVLASKPLDHTASFSCKPQTTKLPIHLLAGYASCHIVLQYKPVHRPLRAPLTCASPGLERQTASVKAVSIL